MKMAVLLTTGVFLLYFTSSAHAQIRNNINATARGGDSKVDVRVNNNVNTLGSTSTTKSETTTKIDIEQSGEGTSSVTINGKEYKVEGEGSLHVDETTGTPKATATPSISATTTPTNVENAGKDNEENKTFIQKFFNELRNKLSRMFSSIF